MAKMYFREDDKEICHELETHRDYMRDNKLKELVLLEAKRETGTGYFFCKEHQEVGDVGESCGKFCYEYKPNNGKNGRCKHYGYCYEVTDIKYILKLTKKEIQKWQK